MTPLFPSTCLLLFHFLNCFSVLCCATRDYLPLLCLRRGGEKGIPVGTPYLKELPDEEGPTLIWITKVVASLLGILTGTIRYALPPCSLYLLRFEPTLGFVVFLSPTLKKI